MIILFICMILNSTPASGYSLSDQVHQSPPDMFSDPGNAIKINCSHTNQNFNRILWYKQSEGRLQFLGYVYFKDANPEPGLNVRMGGSASKDGTCTLTVEKLTVSSSAVYYCAAKTDGGFEVYFGDGTKLTVLEPNHDVFPPTVKVFKPSPNECLQEMKKKKTTLVCVASDFYPDHVKVHWELDGFEVTDGVATDSAAWRNGTGKNYTITSRLTVDKTTWHRPGLQFGCIVRFFNGETYNKTGDFVYGEEDRVRERYLRVTQGARLSYSVIIVKSCIYGAFVAFLVWKLQRSAEKQST